MSPDAEETVSGLLSPDPALALARLLEVEAPDVEAGEPLPLGWHWLYLLDRPSQSDLGEDGHPLRGTVPAPPGPGLRRMWAGGRIAVLGPLRCGERAVRRSQVLRRVEKAGRSGPLTILTVGHRIWQRGALVVDDEVDLVYRPRRADDVPTSSAPAAGSPPEVAGPVWRLPVTASLLFRFSALTYNAHRIHYDRDYAREHEGYPGLLVHGPLQALAMAEGARRRGVRPGRLDYRLLSPLVEGQGMSVVAAPRASGCDAAVYDDSGRCTARAQLAPSTLT